MQDPSHSHTDLHTHGPTPEESAAMVRSTMIGILAIVAALVLVGFIFAWSPWSDGTTVTPGQGGEDTQPAPQRQIPDRSPPQPQDQR